MKVFKEIRFLKTQNSLIKENVCLIIPLFAAFKNPFAIITILFHLKILFHPVILVNADCDTATGMVQRILDVVDEWNKGNADDFGCRLSFSIGCSTYEKGRDVLETLREAGTMMYQNKKEKKNAGT